MEIYNTVTTTPLNQTSLLDNQDFDLISPKFLLGYMYFLPPVNHILLHITDIVETPADIKQSQAKGYF